MLPKLALGIPWNVALLSYFRRLFLPHPIDFRSPAYRALIRSLGESDAAVDWLEVGVREIQRVSETIGSSAVKQLAIDHGANVHPIDLTDLHGRCARLQILAVYQQIEHFLRSFRRTHPRRVEYRRDVDEDPLTATLTAFNIKAEQVGQLEVDLFQHYRIVRNLIMHDPDGNQAKTYKGTCKELQTRVKNSAYSTLEAPNAVDKLRFDDFLLFTRVGKQLAASLCTTTSPTDDEFALYARNDASLMKKLRSLSNSRNRQRCENLVAGFFRERYSVSDGRSKRLAQLVVSKAR
jgi:hypothetical protein